MFGWIRSFWRVPSLDAFDGAIARERLIQGARIVVIDDETPLLIEELKNTGFAVDHDTTGSQLAKLESQIYDVAIVDYHGVGQRLGPGQGLDVLKHIRRVSPRTRVIAYTSRSLNASESEFFRLSHAVLPKDMGLGDSLAVVEQEVRKAFGKEYLFEALVAKLCLANGQEKERIRKALAKALANKNEQKFKDVVVGIAGQAGQKAAEFIIGKLFQTP